MTAQLRSPELVLLVDPTEATGRRLLLRAELAASYVRALGQRSGSLTLAGLQVCKKNTGWLRGRTIRSQKSDKKLLALPFVT